MRVEVNGEPRELPEGSTVRGIAQVVGTESGRGIAVAIDGEVVPKSEWGSKLLRDGQKIEIVRAVQGG